MCAGNPETRESACHGDSGGPLVQFQGSKVNSNHYVQIGKTPERPVWTIEISIVRTNPILSVIGQKIVPRLKEHISKFFQHRKKICASVIKTLRNFLHIGRKFVPRLKTVSIFLTSDINLCLG
jgi:hypothetical protein